MKWLLRLIILAITYLILASLTQKMVVKILETNAFLQLRVAMIVDSLRTETLIKLNQQAKQDSKETPQPQKKSTPKKRR